MNTHSQKQRLSINQKNISVENVMQIIEEKTDYLFMYSTESIDVNRILDVEVTNKLVPEILDEIFRNTNISYKINGHLIALSKDGGASAIIQQTISVSGRVTDSDGFPIPGVTVSLKGTTRGTITDNDGGYIINDVPDGAILVFSFIGMKAQEIPVDKPLINVVMKEETIGLDEVVAIGYGIKKKREITGAISSIATDAISEQTVTGFDQAMAGRLAGVQIVQNSGTPGGSTSIRIRGVGTPGVNEPLYVIDGVPVFPDDGKRVNGGSEGNVLNMINPNDIESIEVLKDAASAAIYGARAANGVVIITTTHGEKGVPKLKMDYYYGVQTFEKRFDMLDANGYKEFLKARGTQFSDSNYDTNWLDEITAPAPMQNINLSLSGGGQASTYFSSLGYLKQDGIVNGTSYERFTSRFNSTSEIDKILKIGTNLSVGWSKQKRKAENSIWSSAVGQALYYPPIVPVLEDTGEYGDAMEYVPSFNQERPNPVANVEVGYDKVSNFKALGNFFCELEFIKGLVYKLNLGIDYENTTTDSYFPGFVLGKHQRELRSPSVSKYIAEEFIWLLENTLSYKFSIKDTHNFNLLAGATQQASRFETLYGSRNNSVSKDTGLTSLSSSPSVNHTANGDFNEWAIASLLGRFDYNYKGKYLFTATVRHDGSSRFASGKQWGTFPSLSAGWIVSDESFFNVDFITNLKIRSSWGKLGNQEIDPFQYLSTLGATAYILNNTSVSAIYPNSVANAGITWETSKQTDIGFDLSLLKNRLTFSADYFDKKTEGILLENQISTIYGYTNSDGGNINPTMNAGVVSNKGYEFALSFKNSEKAVKWAIDLNAATLKNKVESLGGGDAIIYSMNSGLYSTKTDVGSQVGAFYGKIYEGVGEDGHLIFAKDENGDDIQTIIGNPIPNLTYGANFNASYKNFDFSMAWQGVSGNDIFAATLYQIGNFSYSTNNQIKSIYESAGKTAPAVAVADGTDYAASSWFVYSGSFLRLRNLQLGYNLPESLLSKWNISKIRIYISGQNLLTFDKYDVGMNPEVGAYNQNNTSAGVDEGTYPTARVVTTGINITF